MSKIILALALLGSAAAFVPSTVTRSAPTQLSETKDDMINLQNSLAGPPGFWDPLGLTDLTFQLGSGYDNELGPEGTIGWLRHSEIKHGRVAMAAFLGFIAQCTPLVKGPHLVQPYSHYVADVTPQEQWANMPLMAKLQIFTMIGMLESYGEGAATYGSDDASYVHYTKGGQPGYYPPIKGLGPKFGGDAKGGQIMFDLYDPFSFGHRAKSDEAKARGLKSEILNGRAAMMGIFGFISESKVPGSVPILSGIAGFPHSDIDTMAPFTGDFSFL
jgi:hypothetical protein